MCECIIGICCRLTFYYLNKNNNYIFPKHNYFAIIAKSITKRHQRLKLRYQSETELYLNQGQKLHIINIKFIFKLDNETLQLQSANHYGFICRDFSDTATKQMSLN